MNTAHKIQAQIRQNADELRNELNDLYSWEKQMKEQEKKIRQEPKIQNLSTNEPPVRSHVVGKDVSVVAGKQQKANTPLVASAAAVIDPKKLKKTDVETPTEKCEIPIDPNEEKRKQANVIKDRGNQHVKCGEYEKAMEQYTLAIDVFADDPVFYSNRALCYLKLESYDECIEDCERAIEIDKLAVKAYYRRMQANESLGNNMDALKDCTTILTIDPKNVEAKKSLERINQRLRKNATSTKGPNFSPMRKDMKPITPIDKPPHARSKKPLQRVSITDVIGPKDTKNVENSNIQVSDEVIDKLFNSDCGPFVEVKRPTRTAPSTPTSLTAPTTPTATVAPTKIGASETITETKKMKKSVSEPEIKSKVDSNKLHSAISEKPVAKPVAMPQKEVDLLKVSNRPLPLAPTSTAQFYSNWKELSTAQKYQYLKSIEIPKLCKILGAGFDSDTLTDIIQILCDFYLPQKEPTIAATLLEVSKNNQIGILSLLMSTEDRKAISEILNSVKENATTSPTATIIAKNFNLH